MEMHFVDSSNVERIGFEDETLIVWFHNGSVYEYYDVPEFVFRELLTSPSVGSYLRQHVVNEYSSRRIL